MELLIQYTKDEFQIDIKKWVADAIREYKPESKEPGRSEYFLILPILSTTKSTFLVEIQKAVLSLLEQVKRKKALLASNLSGIT